MTTLAADLRPGDVVRWLDPNPVPRGRPILRRGTVTATAPASAPRHVAVTLDVAGRTLRRVWPAAGHVVTEDPTP